VTRQEFSLPIPIDKHAILAALLQQYVRWQGDAGAARVQHSRTQRPPIAFSDAELDVLMNLARPLDPALRDPFRARSRSSWRAIDQPRLARA
jgi:hypothetical protein